MRTLHISVNNKVATYQQRDGNIVCGNSDYQITFTFDDEWKDYEAKTVRFIWNGKHVDIAFSGNTVPIPVISKATLLKVGVYAGELSTTTSAEIPCIFSVLCESDTEGSADSPNTDGVVIDLSNYYTKKEVDTAIANATPEVDLSNYYTKSQIDALLDMVESGGSPIEVATETEMTELLETAEAGTIYKYTGESGTYENGALYIVEEGE